MTGLLQAALLRCQQSEWEASHGLSIDTKGPSAPQLHIVKVVNETLRSYSEGLGPDDAALLVDTFIISFHSANAKLSFVFLDNTVTISKHELGKILREEHALDQLRGAFLSYKCAAEGKLPGECVEQGIRRVLGEFGGLHRHVILHADGNHRSQKALPLALPSRSIHVRNPVAVILSAEKFAGIVENVGKDAMGFQRSFVGNWLETPAVVGMLFNDGLLGQALLHQEAPSKMATSAMEKSEANMSMAVAMPAGDNITVPIACTVPSSQVSEVDCSERTFGEMHVDSEAETDITSIEPGAGCAAVKARKHVGVPCSAEQERDLIKGRIVEKVLSEPLSLQSSCQQTGHGSIPNLVKKYTKKIRTSLQRLAKGNKTLPVESGGPSDMLPEVESLETLKAVESALSSWHDLTSQQAEDLKSLNASDTTLSIEQKYELVKDPVAERVFSELQIIQEAFEQLESKGEHRHAEIVGILYKAWRKYAKKIRRCPK